MRVLFVSSPGLGHFFPLVQLAWAFRTSGHDVIVGIAEHAERATGTGLDIVDVAPDFNTVAVMEQVTRDNPDFATTVATRPAYDFEEWGVQIAAANRPLFKGTMALTDEWKPDLIVYDQGTTVALFAAARAGIPTVQRNLAGCRTRGMHGAIASYLEDLAAEYEVDLPLPAPDMAIECFPPSMIPEEEVEGWFMQWVPYSGGSVLDRPWRSLTDRPLVTISMGTVELQAFGLDSVVSILDAAAQVNDANFVLALGEVDTSPLGTLPDNVTTLGWVPLHILLEDCAGVVHHGGGGTTMTAITSCTPQLLAPDPRDMFQYTGRDGVLRRGVGMCSTSDKVTPEMLTTLIEDKTMRKASEVVRDEVKELPPPAEIVQRILTEVV